MMMTTTMKDPRIMERIPISLSCDLLLSFYLFSLGSLGGVIGAFVRVRGKGGLGIMKGSKAVPLNIFM